MAAVLDHIWFIPEPLVVLVAGITRHCWLVSVPEETCDPLEVIESDGLLVSTKNLIWETSPERLVTVATYWPSERTPESGKVLEAEG
jgi:hypothetical protein